MIDQPTHDDVCAAVASLAAGILVRRLVTGSALASRSPATAVRSCLQDLAACAASIAHAIEEQLQGHMRFWSAADLWDITHRQDLAPAPGQTRFWSAGDLLVSGPSWESSRRLLNSRFAMNERAEQLMPAFEGIVTALAERLEQRWADGEARGADRREQDAALSRLAAYAATAVCAVAEDDALTAVIALLHLASRHMSRRLAPPDSFDMPSILRAHQLT